MRWFLQPTRLVLTLCAILIAAVPALRREFTWNVRALAAAIPHWPKSEYARYVTGRDVAPGFRPYDPQAELDAHPRDVSLRIAVASYGGGPEYPSAKRALDEALALAPRSAVVLSVSALGDFESREFWFHREEEGGGRRTGPGRKEFPRELLKERLTLSQIGAPLKRLDAWAAADPDNAAPHVFAAYLLLGARKDEEPLAKAEQAAGKRFFTVYQPEVTDARVHEMRLRGVPAPDAEAAVLGWPSLAFMHLNALLRNLARIMDGVGWDHFDAGDKNTAFRYWVATGRIGTLMMAREREPLILPMVGMAIQGVGYSPIYRQTWDRSNKSNPRRIIRTGEAYRTFVAARGQRAAQRIRGELLHHVSLSRQFSGLMPAVYESTHPFAYYAVAHQMGTVATANAIMAAFLCVVVLLAGRGLQPALSRAWGGIIVGLAVVATIGVVSTSTTLAVLDILRPLPEGIGHASFVLPDSAWLAAALAYGGPVLVVVLLCVAGVCVARRKKVRYRDVVGGGMRQSLPTMLAVLAVIWVISTAVAAREGGIYARWMARSRHVGELRMLQEFAADRGIGPARSPR